MRHSYGKRKHLHMFIIFIFPSGRFDGAHFRQKVKSERTSHTGFCEVEKKMTVNSAAGLNGITMFAHFCGNQDWIFFLNFKSTIRCIRQSVSVGILSSHNFPFLNWGYESSWSPTCAACLTSLHFFFLSLSSISDQLLNWHGKTHVKPDGP